MSNQCPLWSSSVSCSCFYFILFADSENTHVCLEYFDSEKKWGNGGKKVTFKFPLQQFSKCCQQIFSSSRSIVIKSCFNINRRTDCKHKFVVALYTNKDCFPIAFESEDELLRWFITFLRLQLVDRVSEGEELKFTVRQSLVHTHASLLIQSSL